MKKTVAFFVALFLILSSFAAASFAQDKVVRVGYYITPGFQEYDAATGQYGGYGYEYLLALAQHTGWRYKFIHVGFHDGIEMLKRGELDLMNNVSQTADRAPYIEYSMLPSGENCGYLVMPPNASWLSFEDFKHFKSLRVGLVKRSIFNEKLLDYFNYNRCSPTIMYFDDKEQVLKAVADGHINAYVTTSSREESCHVVGRFAPERFYIAVPKSRRDLLDPLNSAMNSIKTTDPMFEARLFYKYYRLRKEKRLVLSEKEKQFTGESRSVNVSLMDYSYPLSYVDEKGKLKGLLPELMNLISERSGLKFNFIIHKNAKEAEDAIRNGNSDIISAMPSDFIMANTLGVKLTRPFVTMTSVVVSKHGKPKNNDTVLPATSSTEIYNKYGRTLTAGSLRILPTTNECLDAVLNGEASYTVMNGIKAEFYQTKAKYSSLAFRQMRELGYSLSMGVSNTADPNLFPIIYKTLDTISDNDVSCMLNQASQADRRLSVMDFIYLNPALSVAIFSFAGFAIALIIAGVLYIIIVRKKNRALRLATAAKSDFLARMSHDIRTPMNAIIGLTAIARDETEDPAAVREYLDKITSSSNLLLRLINDVLDMSKIESNTVVLNPVNFNLNEFSENLRITIAPQCQRKNITFVCDFSKCGAPDVTFDRVRLAQILVNLLSNAVKFTPEGGCVQIHAVELSKDGGVSRKRFIVSDNGIGIDKNFQNHMFEPFAQESNETTAEFYGTGLGLAIVKSLVDVMHGKISVVSSAGNGSEFSVDLDFQLAEAQKESSAASSCPMGSDDQLNGLRVLLCEDHPLNTEIVKKLLSKKGVEVVSAKNGEEGLSIFRGSKPWAFDMILMDIRMPVMDGLAAATEIRSMDREDAREIPIIAMTANAYNEDVRRSREAGMNEHLAKPIAPSVLFRIMAQFARRNK